MPNTPLTIRVPIRGKLLIKLDGFDALHEVGDFTKELDVSISMAGGNVDFHFDPKFWTETIRDKGVGAATPTPSDAPADEEAVDAIEALLKEQRVMGPEPYHLASMIYYRLRKEGKLK